ncbi:MAG: hypothetical protein AUG43_05745 [Actinobacteria bacterium 13_1_20CM_3_68_10]|nr:MAG: hypothetical protein AUG43_05745 [Actinobacteria bacterium 13_1_20CM_3_68_10]
MLRLRRQHELDAGKLGPPNGRCFQLSQVVEAGLLGAQPRPLSRGHAPGLDPCDVGLEPRDLLRLFLNGLRHVDDRDVLSENRAEPGILLNRVLDPVDRHPHNDRGAATTVLRRAVLNRGDVAAEEAREPHRALRCIREGVEVLDLHAQGGGVALQATRRARSDHTGVSREGRERPGGTFLLEFLTDGP